MFGTYSLADEDEYPNEDEMDLAHDITRAVAKSLSTYRTAIAHCAGTDVFTVSIVEEMLHLRDRMEIDKADLMRILSSDPGNKALRDQTQTCLQTTEAFYEGLQNEVLSHWNPNGFGLYPN